MCSLLVHKFTFPTARSMKISGREKFSNIYMENANEWVRTCTLENSPSKVNQKHVLGEVTMANLPFVNVIPVKNIRTWPFHYLLICCTQSIGAKPYHPKAQEPSLSSGSWQCIPLELEGSLLPRPQASWLMDLEEVVVLQTTRHPYESGRPRSEWQRRDADTCHWNSNMEP